MTMTLVSTVTVGAGGASSIDFTSIPQTGTDLLIMFSLRSLDNGGPRDYIKVRFNGITTSTYTVRYLEGDGSVAASGVFANQSYWYTNTGLNGSTSTSNTFANSQIYLPNYSSSNAKTGSVDSVSENNATQAGQTIAAWSSTTTAAITSLSIIGNTNWAQYSTASLYTILKGSGGASVS